MQDIEEYQNEDEGMDLARKLAEEEAGVGRKIKGKMKSLYFESTPFD